MGPLGQFVVSLFLRSLGQILTILKILVIENLINLRSQPNDYTIQMELTYYLPINVLCRFDLDCVSTGNLDLMCLRNILFEKYEEHSSIHRKSEGRFFSKKHPHIS